MKENFILMTCALMINHFHIIIRFKIVPHQVKQTKLGGGEVSHPV